MNKTNRVDRIYKMLNYLRRESSYGGFNEFPQFCEDWLILNLHQISASGLEKLTKDIREVSELGITFRKVNGQMDL